MRVVAALAFVLLGSACATLHEPVPKDYGGPTAEISDSAVEESGSKARLFVVQQINGKDIDNSILATRRTSKGQGFFILVVTKTRSVPIEPMKLKLVATHQTGAPIHEFTSRIAGEFFSVEGLVDFKPEPGSKYIVKGELKKEGSSVWIEDVATKRVVTEKVRSKTP